jgi:hypothetical protein
VFGYAVCNRISSASYKLVKVTPQNQEERLLIKTLEAEKKVIFFHEFGKVGWP